MEITDFSMNFFSLKGKNVDMYNKIIGSNISEFYLKALNALNVNKALNIENNSF